MSKSEEILARKAKYDRVEREADAYGRLFGVKRLKPSQQLRIQEMAPGLAGETTVAGEDGKDVSVPKILPLLLAAAVVEIDGSPLTFPRNRAELDSVLDMLEDTGMAAVAKALSRFGADDVSDAGAQDAKNSAMTPA